MANATEPGGDDLGAALLARLNSEQQVVVDVVCDSFFNEGSWPTFEYVEWQLDRQNLELGDVLDSFPIVGRRPGLVYGAIVGLGGSLPGGSTINVTVIGLWQCRSASRQAAHNIAHEAVQVIQLFDTYRLLHPPPVTQGGYVSISSNEVLHSRALQRPSEWMKTDAFARQLLHILENEPATRSGHSSNSERTEWTWTINREVRRYRGADTVEKYATRMAHLLAVPGLPAGRVLPSPLDLPASLGYLDTAWRLLHDRTHLMNLHSPEMVASLAFDAGSRAEFFDRLSALCDVFKSFHVPKGGNQKGGHPLARLGPYLRAKLQADSHERVEAALSDLGHIVNIRNGGEHGEAQDRAASSYLALGVRLPVVDWPEAWATIRARGIAAIDALRDELLAATEERGE